MPTLTFPIQPDGLPCDLLVGLDGQSTAALQASGHPLLPPARCRGHVDTGTNVTCVAPTVLPGLGLTTPRWHSTTQTVSGPAPANLFSVSLSITDFATAVSPMLTLPTLRVMELPATLPDVDALIGLDILRAIRLVVDGPGAVFTLEW